MISKKQELRYKAIQSHGFNLIRALGMRLTTDPFELCRKLRRLENEASRWTTALCNGDVEQEELETKLEKVYIKLDKLVEFKRKKIPVLINRDPRGYALKIDDAFVRENRLDIYRDMGGYGILAPEF